MVQNDSVLSDKLSEEPGIKIDLALRPKDLISIKNK